MKQSQKYTRVNYSAEPRVYLGIPFTRVTVNLRLVTPSRPPLPHPMVGAEGRKIFDFDNPRSLEKALSGKELHRKSTKTTSQKC